MPTTTISSKNQITLPADIVRRLGLKAGDKLAVELIDGEVLIVPEPTSWVAWGQGIAAGLYGGTKESVDRYVAEERAGWDDDSPDSFESFADYYMIQGPSVRALIDALAEAPWQSGASTEDLAHAASLSGDQAAGILDYTLAPNGWVRRVAREDGVRYRLRRDLAHEIRSAE